MPKISESTVARIKERSNIKEVIEDFQAVNKSGSSFYTKCPECGKDKKNKGLIITPSKSIAKCFSCGFAITNSVAYLMKAQNHSYPEALHHLASKYNILIQEDRLVVVYSKKVRPKASKKSFLEIQLTESGLKIEDIQARVFEDDAAQTLRETQIFRTGTKDQYNQLVSGDDMIIRYFDLDGNKVMYQKRSVLHAKMKKVAPDNRPENIQERKEISDAMALLSDEMDHLALFKNQYEQTGKLPEMDQVFAKPEPGKPAEVDLKVVEKQRLNLQKSIARDRILLDYQSKTKLREKNPMPNGPKRVMVEKRVKEKLSAIKELDKILANDPR